jgi:flagellar motor switch protein FliN/FliY
MTQDQTKPEGSKFEEFKEEKTEKVEKVEQATAKNIDFLLDIPLDLTVELGRARLLIKDLLQLGQGSVVELEKLAGEPMEILVNNKLVARGEVVVVNEKFGVRLTDIISPSERIQQLK